MLRFVKSIVLFFFLAEIAPLVCTLSMHPQYAPLYCTLSMTIPLTAFVLYINLPGLFVHRLSIEICVILVVIWLRK